VPEAEDLYVEHGARLRVVHLEDHVIDDRHGACNVAPILANIT
jgi:hypothetical protein